MKSLQATVTDASKERNLYIQLFYDLGFHGNWRDATVWQTASGRVGLLPSVNDDVYIRHTVTADQFLTPNIKRVLINNLFISGNFIINTGGTGGVFFYINGSVQCVGTFDVSLFRGTFCVNGNNNKINNFIIGTNFTFDYAGSLDQDIINIPYNNLTLTGGGIKKLTSNLTINNSLLITVGPTLETLFYNLTVNGVTNLYASVPASTSNCVA
jgi:hypothetical protein